MWSFHCTLCNATGSNHLVTFNQSVQPTLVYLQKTLAAFILVSNNALFYSAYQV